VAALDTQNTVVLLLVAQRQPLGQVVGVIVGNAAPPQCSSLPGVSRPAAVDASPTAAWLGINPQTPPPTITRQSASFALGFGNLRKTAQTIAVFAVSGGFGEDAESSSAVTSWQS